MRPARRRLPGGGAALRRAPDVAERTVPSGSVLSHYPLRPGTLSGAPDASEEPDGGRDGAGSRAAEPPSAGRLTMRQRACGGGRRARQGIGSDSTAPLTVNPGSGPPAIAQMRPFRATTPSPWRGVGRSGSRAQRAARTRERPHSPVRAGRRLAADRDDPAGDRRGSGPATRVGEIRLARPATRARVVGLHGAEIRVVAGQAAADRVDAAAQRRRGQVLARPGPPNDTPAKRPQVERQRA